MKNHKLAFFFISLLFFLSSSCLREKILVKENLPEVKKIPPFEDMPNEDLPRDKPNIDKRIDKREDIHEAKEDLYKTRLLLFEKLYQYKKTYGFLKNTALLLEVKELRDLSFKYSLLKDYQKANYYLIEALALIEEP
ncbi:hypothetical protein KKB54_05605 [bacterium]|nr:hypothetical protein [bacterium]MBU0900271.1 hypothetical protein [bacterium]MBU1152859.1 hypothetical protein [bacterium]MBU2600191.1 hypothetical protein [bacterium]